MLTIVVDAIALRRIGVKVGEVAERLGRVGTIGDLDEGAQSLQDEFGKVSTC